MKRLGTTVLTIIGAAAVPAAALTTNAGGNVAEFLVVGAGGRALGMGDALGPVVEGAESMYWNPAGLQGAASPEAAYAHAEMNQFFRLDHLAYAHPVEALGGSLGAAVTLWTMDAIDARTASNVQSGKFAPHSEAFSIGYARTFWQGSELPARDRELFGEGYDVPFSHRPFRDDDPFWQGSMRAGVAVKFINETIRARNASSFAVDGGVQYYPFQIPEGILSFAFRNLGSRPVFITDRGSLPVEVAFGAAYDARWERRRLLPAAEIIIPYYGDPSLRLGVEYGVAAGGSSEVFFRAGYKTVSAPYLNPVSGATVGVGFRINRFHADVGFQPMAELENVLRVSLGWKF